VPELAGHPVPATVQSSAENDAAADAGAHGDHQRVGHAACCAVRRLRVGGGGRVVLQEHGNTPAFLESSPDGLVEPGQVRREPDLLPRRVHEAGRRDTDRGQLGIPSDLANGLGQRVLDHAGINPPPRGGPPRGAGHNPGTVHQTGQHLGAAHVHTDPDLFRRHGAQSVAVAARTRVHPPEFGYHQVD